MFTDVGYVITNYNCENMSIFYSSFGIMSVAIIFNMTICLSFFWKLFIKQKKNEHNSGYINTYSKASFSLEMYGIGRVLDKFSTSSATKLDFFWLPSAINNIYIPLIIISTFQRLFLEDIPQIIV